MPNVTGELSSLLGASMAAQVGKVRFRLNEPGIVASGSAAGRVIPTSSALITPESDKTFTANLAQTTLMLSDAFYIMTIEWNDTTQPNTDYPQWQIRVPASGGSLHDLISLGSTSGGGGGGGAVPNGSLVLMGLTEPPGLRRGQLWWKTDPNNPYGPANTGKIYIGG